jgi:phosphatidylserine/phosphatidylglycerophosphate/cardiolipin synthase-like enzyme
VLTVQTLTDGGQKAQDIADKIIAFISEAQKTLDCALYDIRLPGTIGDDVRDAFLAAQSRGVKVRLVYNLDGEHKVVDPPPPSTIPEILESIDLPTRGIPGEPDLMHHKYAVCDGKHVWTGSMNWTIDSWTRQENLIAVVESEQIAAEYQRSFDELWTKQKVENSGRWNGAVVDVGDAKVRPWFTPGRGPALSQRIAEAIGRADRRVRIASPVLTAGPILGTLAEVCNEGRLDVLGVCDWTQLHAVFGQWAENPNSAWKGPLLAEVLDGAQFNGKRSEPYAPGSLHNFMHAKVTVADDTVFMGSFNLSRSGERNAENVLEVTDPKLADQMAAFIEGVRDLYEDVVPPEFPVKPPTDRASIQGAKGPR